MDRRRIKDPTRSSTMRLLVRFGPVIDSSAYDFEGLVDAVRAHEPDAILSMHDGDLVWTARLAEELRLPFHSLETAQKLTDKHAQRDALAAAGLIVPMFRILPRHASAAEVASIAGTFRYPAVLKPRWGQSSRNTLPISSSAELLATLEELGRSRRRGLRARRVHTRRQPGTRWPRVRQLCLS